MSINWEDSSTYRLICEKGEALGWAKGTQNVLLLVGRQRFGAAPPPIEAALRAINDSARLERMAARLLTATDWNDLLATP